MIEELIAEALARRERERKRPKPKKKRRQRLKGLARAQAWALQHFNANQPVDQTTILHRASFKVRFVGDKMFAAPQLYGESMIPEAEYVLSDSPMGLVWVGHNPMTGFALPLLWVTGVFYEED